MVVQYSSTLSSTSESNIKVEGDASRKFALGGSLVDENTVALWHLDETNGDLAGDDMFDATANDNDGEFNGTPALTDGLFGKAGKTGKSGKVVGGFG